MGKGKNKPKKEKKKQKKSKGIKGNGYSRTIGRTYPGLVGMPNPDLPGTQSGVSY